MTTTSGRILAAATAVGLASAVSLAAATTASAKQSPRVTVTKMCGSIATKLKVAAEDVGTQVEYELDQNVNGKAWALSLTANGARVASATRTTKAPSGSLHWRVTPGGASTGTFTVKAKKGSRTCTITATL